MKKILLLGAGRSTNSLIGYLKITASEKGWAVRVGDYSEELARKKVQHSANASAFRFDVFDEAQRRKEIKQADVVISMLPAHLHYHVARDCIALGKNMTSASYISDEIKSLHAEAEKKGVTILKECGLDPGIDHMSAMRVIDVIKAKGELQAFETFTGGLLAPSDKDNPWQYKFTWNPRNVVLAGQGGVKFLQEGRYKYIPYHRLFSRTEIVHIPGHGYFEGYANRDSLKYVNVYHLKGIRTLYRGTFRRPGFCRAWNIFVQLGATDDSYEMEQVATMTHRQFINSFLAYNPHDSVELKLAHYMNIGLESEEMYRLKWLGVFADEPVGLEHGTPAQILEHILMKKWKLEPDDHDMIVMWHKFDFLENGIKKQIQSHLVVEGESQEETAMARTVGLTLGIVTRLLLEGKIKTKGVIAPIHREIYEPTLKELEKNGIAFMEKELTVEKEDRML